MDRVSRGRSGPWVEGTVVVSTGGGDVIINRVGEGPGSWN